MLAIFQGACNLLHYIVLTGMVGTGEGHTLVDVFRSIDSATMS